MKVLVCRPQGDADDLAQKFILKGFVAVSFPTVKICYREVSKDILNFDSLVFTSKYAIESLFNKYSFNLFKNKKIYSVGSSTASVLKKYDFDVIYPQNYGSQELLNLMLQKNIIKEKIAIVSGVGGNNLLLNELSKITQCYKFTTYARVFIEQDKLLEIYKSNFLDNSPDIIVATSLDIFKSLARILPQINMPKNTIITITSDKMLKFVNQLGFKNVLKLEKLDNNYICERIIDFYRGRQCQ